jgi:hypothetical protein
MPIRANKNKPQGRPAAGGRVSGRRRRRLGEESRRKRGWRRRAGEYLSTVYALGTRAGAGRPGPLLAAFEFGEMALRTVPVGAADTRAQERGARRQQLRRSVRPRVRGCPVAPSQRPSMSRRRPLPFQFPAFSSARSWSWSLQAAARADH